MVLPPSISDVRPHPVVERVGLESTASLGPFTNFWTRDGSGPVVGGGGGAPLARPPAPSAPPPAARRAGGCPSPRPPPRPPRPPPPAPVARAAFVNRLT